MANGNAPDQIIASHTKGSNDPAFWPQYSYTRPLCPYPEVARWTGKGDWKDAANWVCKVMGLGVSAEQNDPANLLYGMKR